MILIIPILILILASLAIVILQWIKPNMGLAWLISAGSSLIVWIVVLVLHWVQVNPIDIYSWRPIEGILTSLNFKMDLVAWPYAFSLVSVLLAAVLTAPMRFSYETAPRIWAGFLIITASGLLAILSGNALTLILTWTVIDITEFILLIRSTQGRELIQSSVFTFAMKIIGTFFVLWAMAISGLKGDELTFTNITPEVGVYILIGSGFRLGIVPLHLPYSQEVQFRRGLGTVLRLVSAASSLVVLGRMPPAVVSPNLAIFLLLFTALAGLYGSVRWLSSKDELSGRPFWLIALAGMAFACTIRGRPAASITWGMMLVLSGGTIFLYSNRGRKFLLFPMLGFISLTGLPFTPASFGWYGLILFPFSILDILFILVYIILLAGYLKQVLRSGISPKPPERWAEFIYPLGIGFLIAAQWIINIFGWPGSFTSGIWWASLTTTVSAISGGIIYHKFGSSIINFLMKRNWILFFANNGLKRIAGFANFDWFYSLLRILYSFFQRLVQVLALVLEGEGGILWALVLLVLMITVFGPGASP